MLTKSLEQVKKKFPDLEIIERDAEKGTDGYAIVSVPFMVIQVEGKEDVEIVGAVPPSEIERHLK